jgi:hypothetical protein
VEEGALLRVADGEPLAQGEGAPLREPPPSPPFPRAARGEALREEEGLPRVLFDARGDAEGEPVAEGQGEPPRDAGGEALALPQGEGEGERAGVRDAEGLPVPRARLPEGEREG